MSNAIFVNIPDTNDMIINLCLVKTISKGKDIAPFPPLNLNDHIFIYDTYYIMFDDFKWSTEYESRRDSLYNFVLLQLHNANQLKYYRYV
tara:strand:- start:620 stop:889 length:270 start_codon:yes stop_codon:yes gene_type:complete